MMKNVILMMSATILIDNTVFADGYNNYSYNTRKYNKSEDNYDNGSYSSNGRPKRYTAVESNYDDSRYSNKKQKLDAEADAKAEAEAEHQLRTEKKAARLWEEAQEKAEDIIKQQTIEASPETDETADNIKKRLLHIEEIRQLSLLIQKQDETERDEIKKALYLVVTTKRAKEKLEKLGYPTSSPQYKGALHNEIETQKELMLEQESTLNDPSNEGGVKEDKTKEAQAKAENAIKKGEKLIDSVGKIASDENIDKLEKGAEKAKKAWGRLSGLFGGGEEAGKVVGG